MIYDRYLELQSKWNKSFWARGYYAVPAFQVSSNMPFRRGKNKNL